MRRTTICRSNAVFAAVLVAGAGVAPLAAQLPPPIQRPISQAQGVQQQGAQRVQQQQQAGQDPAQASGRVQLIDGRQGAQGNVPASHVVQQGETLWQLAQQFFGDPLLWPEIYRLNTDVIEDPHWIFPGEELRLAAGDDPIAPEGAPGNVTVTPQGDTVRAQVEARTPMTTTGPTIFSPSRQGLLAPEAIDARVEESYRAVREGQYYGAGFLTENQTISSGRVLASANSSSRGNLRTATTSGIFQSVLIEPPTGSPLDTGTLLLSFRRTDEIPGWGEVVVPTGLLRVYNNSGQRHLAEIVRQFDRVIDGQEVIPIAPFRFESNAHPQPVENGMAARVIRLRDRREVAGLTSVLFLDKGANDGVRLGDVFALTIELPDGQGGTLVQDQARALVVGTRDRTSTAVIVELYRGDVGSRSAARLVRRIP